MTFRLLALAIAALSASGCFSVTSTTTPLGGGWSVETQRVSGSEPGYLKKRLRRGSTVVDDWVQHVQFFPPDCVLYQVNTDDLPVRAVCGNRARIQLPSWIIEVREDGPWGGYKETPRADGRTTNERWSRIPMERVIAAAQARWRFLSILGWSPAPSIQDFERTYIDLIGNPPPPDVPLNFKKGWQNLESNRLCAGGEQTPGIGATNDEQLAVSQLFEITTIDVWSIGSDFEHGPSNLEKYMRGQLARKPRRLFRFNPFEPDHRKPRIGVNGSINLANGRSGVFEAIGRQMCMADSKGQIWWFSLATDNVWPGPELRSPP